MGEVSYPPSVKLIAGLIISDLSLMGEMNVELEDRFGAIDLRSDIFPFDHTSYYEREMGAPLHRLYLSFARLAARESLVEVKQQTNALEGKWLHPVTGGRRVNIDPGYISLEQMVLATVKGSAHRIYLGRGLYADLTYLYRNGSFQPLEWTYPDYRLDRTIAFFNAVRQRYRERLASQRRGRRASGPGG